MSRRLRLWAAVLGLVTAGILIQRARRDARMGQGGPDWSPKPEAAAQRVRQAVCFLWRHDLSLAYDAPEVGEDGDPVEHPYVVEECRRCGMRIGHCLVCEGYETVHEE